MLIFRVLVVFAIIVGFAGLFAVSSSELSMKSPSPVRGATESDLGSTECDCTKRFEEFYRDVEGFDPGSREVSYSDDYGYVLRYKINKVYPYEGKTITVQIIVVAWTRDCGSFSVINYPAPTPIFGRSRTD